MENKTFRPELSEEDRLRKMEQTADKVEETSYYRKLSDTEMVVSREEYSNKSIELGDLEEKLTTIKTEFKGKMDPLKKDKENLLQVIRTGQEKVEGRLFHFADHDAGVMESFTETGELHSTRRLRPDERQATILRAVS